MSQTRQFNREPIGRLSLLGTGGPVMRPAGLTLELTGPFTPLIDTAPVDWTNNNHKLPIQVKSGPFMENLGFNTIANGTEIVTGPSVSLVEFHIMVSNTTGTARKAQCAMVNEGGAIYNVYPEITIQPNATVAMGGVFLTHNGPEDTSDEYAISVVQTDGATQDLLVDPEYWGYVIKIGNTDESLRLRG